MEFTKHARHALLAGEKEGSVCSFCGTKLPINYYLLLSAWRFREKELVSPTRRFCEKCWHKIEKTLTKSKPIAMDEERVIKREDSWTSILW